MYNNTKTAKIYNGNQLLRTVEVWLYAQLDSDWRRELEPKSTHYEVE